MTIIYRFSGLIAGMCLVIYTFVSFLIFYLIEGVLTLPGIAGIILTLGMAVDSNVLIYERVKEEFRSGKTELKYPDRIKDNVHAQAFYGVVSAILDEVIPLSDNRDAVAALSAEITEIIKEYSKIDWTSNTDIHKKISHALDDVLYDYSDNNGWELSFEIMDKIIENVKTIALRRF